MDALYVALATRLNAPLLTLDQKPARAGPTAETPEPDLLADSA